MLKLLSKNIVIYGGTNALKSLIPLLMLPILTSHLSLSDFGILSLVETTILLVVPFVLLNINGAINIEYFKLKHSELKMYVTNAFLLSLCVTSFVLLIAIIFQNKLAALLHIENFVIVWIVVFAMLRVVSSVLLGLYQSRQEPTKFALFTLLQAIFDFSMSYLLVVLYQYGYIGRLAGIYSVYCVFSLIGVYLLYKMDYLGKITLRYTKDILSFGLPLIPHALSGTVISMSDRYFISYFEGTAQVGVYTISYQLSALMLLVGMSVNQAWSPMLFKLLKENNIQQVYKFTIYLFGLFLVAAIAIFFFKDILFSIFIDEKFYGAKEYFVWLLIGFLFQSFYFLVTNLLFFEKQTKQLAMITFLGAITNIILNYYFIKSYGTIGVAYSTAITWGLYFLIVVFLDIKIIKRFYV